MARLILLVISLTLAIIPARAAEIRVSGLAVDVEARIRDLEVLPDKRLIASTDDGRLLIFSSPSS